MTAHARRRTLVTLLVLAFLIALAGLIVFVGSARAGEPSPSPSPTLVRECTGLRTEYSRTFLMSDGSYRAQYSSSPLFARDEAGAWQPVSASLVPVGGGAYETAAAPVEVRAASEAAGSEAVTVEKDGHRVSLDLVGRAEDGKLILGDTAVYADVAPQTDVTYTALGDGLRELITLRSPAAPRRFTYRLSHPGLALAEDELGEWALYQPGEAEPTFVIGPLCVADSSRDESGQGAFCEDATMTVAPGRDASTITYALPRAWLGDPARVWPVTIDPDLFSRNPTDVYLSSANPGTAMGSADARNLCCGKVTASNNCRTLIKFPQVGSLPAGCHVTSAELQVRQYDGPSSARSPHVYYLNASSSLWGENSTWNNTSLDSTEISDHITQVPSGDGSWLRVDCSDVAQMWVAGYPPNKGFQIRQTNAEGTGYGRRFRSGEYGSAQWRPSLTVSYEAPSVSVTPSASRYRLVDDTVVATLSLAGVSDWSQVGNVKIAINNTGGPYRGTICWHQYADQPPSGTWVGTTAVSGGGYVASLTDNHWLTPQPAACRIDAAARTITLAFKLSAAFGDQQDNDFDTQLVMSSGALANWQSGWVHQDTDVDVLPQRIARLTATTTPSAKWFVGTGPDDLPDRGRGTVNLSWTPCAGATGYYVYLWDGHGYRKVDTLGDGAASSWSSSGKGIYPSDSEIAALDDDYSGNPFKRDGSGSAGSGLDLRDSPEELYAKTAGTEYDGSATYYARVVPFGSAGSLAVDENAAAAAQLPDRSVPSRDAQHTTADLGGWDGHGFACQLDDGRLTADVTDLAIASLGPEAALSRSYLSNEGATRFAPGWRFGFEQCLSFDLTAEPATVTYTDEAQATHTFYRADAASPWEAPNGFFTTLTQSSDGTWRLLFDQDQSCLTFSSDGRLLAESDVRGLSTTYSWDLGQVVIDAANGQQIVVALDGSGRVTSASYATGDGTRTVAYAGSGSEWSVAYNAADTGASGTARTVDYVYDGALLAEVAQPGWPRAGESAVLRCVYDGARLAGVEYPDLRSTDLRHTVEKPDARVTIEYGESQATVQRYGTRADEHGTEHANAPMQRTEYHWRPASSCLAGQQTRQIDGVGGAATLIKYEYSGDQQLESETAYEGDDDEGEVLEDWDAEIDADEHELDEETLDSGSDASADQVTTYTYDDEHQVTAETTIAEPAASGEPAQEKSTATCSTYDDTGNVIEEWQELREPGSTTPVVSSYALRSYDAGRLTMEKKLIGADYIEPGALAAGEDRDDRTITNPVWAETDYSDFAPNGEPQTTVAKNVELSSGGSAQDLTKTTTYDEFGNLTAETDWAGTTTQANIYDLAGRQLSSTDAAGVVTHASYDVLGNAVATYQTVSGSNVKAGWSTTAYDAMGRALAVTTKLSDANGDPTTQSVVTNAYDGSGHQLSSHDTTVGGEDEKWIYDAKGNVIQHWAMGVRAYDDARSTRTAYDDEGQVIGESQSGNSNAAGSSGSDLTTYDEGGQVTSETKADGNSTTYAYDGEGNQTEAESTVSGTTTTTYGASGQVTATTDERGFETGSTYDLLGRVVGSQGSTSGASATTTTYNTLGWVLQTVDASGVTVTKSYDAHGNVVSEARGSVGATTSTYDAAGNLLTQTDPNGSVVTNTYDAFGNLTGEVHSDWNSATLKNVTTAYDSLGRPLSESESVSGRTHTWTYPVNTAAGVEETITYDGTPLTATEVERNARGMETSRTTTIASGTTVTRATSDTVGARDLADHWTTATVQLTGYDPLSFVREFDDAGRVTAQSGAGFSSAGNYSYSATKGLKTAQTLPLLLGGTISDSYSYASDGRLSGWNGNTYAYDAAGNLTGDTAGSGTTFTYDAANRLTQSVTGSATTLYGWDATNAWRTSQGPSGTPNQLQYTYTKSGGSTSNGRMTRYQNSDASTDAAYTYDASGQRTKSDATVDSTETVTNFTYDGLTLLKLTATQGEDSWRIDYLYDEEGALYGGVYRDPAGSTGPTAFTVVTNDHGDVLELLDANGDAFASYRYDPWGLPLASGTTTASTNLIDSTLAASIASRQVLRYASYAYDAESGLYYCSARYYDPATRQWTTGDPAKDDGEESAHQYCGGKPIACVDADGCAWKHKTHTCWAGKGDKFFLDVQNMWQFNTKKKKVKNVNGDDPYLSMGTGKFWLESIRNNTPYFESGNHRIATHTYSVNVCWYKKSWNVSGSVGITADGEGITVGVSSSDSKRTLSLNYKIRMKHNGKHRCYWNGVQVTTGWT